ncbi:hypothetical protein [Arthrobacter sp. MDT2-2]
MLSLQGARPWEEKRILIIVTAISTIGVGYAVYLASSSGSPLDALASGRGNELNQAIGGESGLATLRYGAAVAAPLALYLWRKGVCGPRFLWFNGALLAISALFSSRLSLVLAVVVGLVLLSTERSDRRIKASALIIYGTIAYLLLSAYNWFRNFRFYESWGVDDPLAMNAYQILSYLGSPFQVSLGISNAMLNQKYDPESSFTAASMLIVPTFFQPDGGSVERGAARYDYHADILGSLTTNSSFADVYSYYGIWGFLWLAAALFVAAIMMGHALSYNSAISAVGGVMAYCLLELWRIPLFNQGMIVFLIVLMFGASVLASFFPHSLKSEVSRSQALGRNR